ncbi:MAG TPA: diaminopimelate epimerase [Streptosporangiaceae bacterium]|nr:diaminopimelate epimerase [Streptosporangiaceae bacterium]
MIFAKGHGTGNDFVILPDVDDRLQLTPELVRRLCDRRAGIGGDGVLRVAPGKITSWFMDYWNGDGSVAEMCGNGIRVFTRYLLDHGLATGPELAIETRAGVRTVRQESGELFSVDMGPVKVGGPATARVGGKAYDGLSVDVGNPHLVIMVSEPVAGFNLTEPPEVDAADFPDGVNVELVRPTGDRAVEMRVHERGSGETLSCGTGAVASAAAASVAAGRWPDGSDRWLIRVPGGTLTVTPGATASVLTGPAVIVAEGELSTNWLGLSVS